MNSTQILGQQIEALVRAHVSAYQVELTASVTTAVKRGFTAVKSQPVSQPRQKKSPSKRAPQRTPEELAALSEAFYSVVCDKPGETMAVLASQLEMTSRQLEVPVLKLKRAGRVRSVGLRAKTRYFPLVGDAKASEAVNS